MKASSQNDVYHMAADFLTDMGRFEGQTKEQVLKTVEWYAANAYCCVLVGYGVVQGVCLARQFDKADEDAPYNWTHDLMGDSVWIQEASVQDLRLAALFYQQMFQLIFKGKMIKAPNYFGFMRDDDRPRFYKAEALIKKLQEIYNNGQS